MSRLKELTDNKNKIINSFINNEDLIKSLIFIDDNFLDKPLPVDFKPTTLLYSHIFPYQHIPIIESDAKSMITMSFDYRPHDASFKVCAVRFYAITHSSLVSTDYGLRIDFIASEIDEMFNQSRIIGIGKLPFYGMRDFIVDKAGSWVGNEIAYRTFEFN